MLSSGAYNTLELDDDEVKEDIEGREDSGNEVLVSRAPPAEAELSDDGYS